MPSNSPPRRTPVAVNRNQPARPELIDPAFLLKGVGIVFGVALILAYVTLCVVYSRSQWQLVLHPSRTITVSPGAVGLAFTEVHFGVDASGEPQLDGWWIPAEAVTNQSSSVRTVLMLHSATGNMADALGTAQLLHRLNLNVLLFDYRGYGRSAGAHPSQAAMQQDAHAALDYLLRTRSLPGSSLIVYGRDLGAPLALDLCATAQIECPATVLDAPDGDLLERVEHDVRSRAVPASLLFHERFPLAAPLRASPAPKLLISYSNNRQPETLRNADDTKMLLAVRPDDTASLRAGIQRFFEDNSPQN